MAIFQPAGLAIYKFLKMFAGGKSVHFGTDRGGVSRQQWGTSKLAIFCLRIFMHARFGEPDGPRFEDAIAKLRKRPEQAFQAHPVCLVCENADRRKGGQ
jgi:hypothetical protein